MKAKKSLLYECQHCGWQSSKWLGKCPNCNSWESLMELKHDYIHSKQNLTHNTKSSQHAKALPITQVQEEIIDYFSSTQSEFDIVLGGGIVKGGLYLIGGSPGVGKSTLLLKVAGGLANGVYQNSKYFQIESNNKIIESSASYFNFNSSKDSNLANNDYSYNSKNFNNPESTINLNNNHFKHSQKTNNESNKNLHYLAKNENNAESKIQDSINLQHQYINSKTTQNIAHIDSVSYKNEHTDSINSKEFIESKPIESDSRNHFSQKEHSNITESGYKNSTEFENYKNKNTNTTDLNAINTQGKKVLYVSGEESLSQIYNRAKRCQCLSDNLYLLSEINILEIKEALLNGGFDVCIIDSIQTIYSPNLSAAPGSVSQVREITFELMRLAKSFNIAMFIIGHITKDGQIAGPRVLEHMVDCVLYFEGERSNELKILRGFKNRFGTTSEIGIFEMRANGLVSANEATKKFFNAKKDMPGSAAVAIMEGSRCIVVEIQALTCENEFGVPKRLTNGFDSNRLNMILALLEKKLGIHLYRHDVFVNVAGGIKISETSADLALIASILSSYKNRPLKSSTAFIGEVSLIGDIREVGGLEARLKELANFGFKNAIVPNIPKSYKGQVKCVQALEVAQIIEWM